MTDKAKSEDKLFRLLSGVRDPTEATMNKDWQLEASTIIQIHCPMHSFDGVTGQVTDKQDAEIKVCAPGSTREYVF
mgnify:CR=1 FL=1